MDYNDNQIKEIINKYSSFVDSISCDEKIKNLLYLIVPAFIVRYSLDNERLILNTFKDVKIVIDDEENINNPAFYQGIPYIDNDNVYISKTIVIKHFKTDFLVGLLNNLVHEYNHALNSYNNPYFKDDNYIYIRTGLTYIKYSKIGLKAVNKDDSYILEEILNTFQTEEVLNIIHSFKKYEFSNPKVRNALYILDTHMESNYELGYYYLEKFFSKDLLSNKTFTSTLSNLRLKGEVNDIEYWFNNITGIKDSYNKLISYLIKLNDLRNKKPSFFFGERKLKKDLRYLYKEVLYIINTFNNNCTFK